MKNKPFKKTSSVGVMKQDSVQSAQEIINEKQKLLALRFFVKLSASVMLTVGLINIIIFNDYDLGAIELFLSFVAVLMLRAISDPNKYNLVANIFVFLCGSSIVSLALFFNLDASTLIWVGLFPIFSFYLFGTKKGLIAHAFFSIIIISLVMLGIHTIPDPLTPRTYVNLIAYLFLSGFLIYFYEDKKQKSIEIFQELSYIDQLTQISNRKKFDEVLLSRISYARRYKASLAVIMVDIDYFKDINDHFGHLKGDEVLIEFANLLKNNIRLSDTISRWGGEEFIVLLPSHTKEDAEKLALKLKKLVADYAFNGIKELTASFGVTEYLIADSAETFLSRLDAALYQAKEEGRNKVVTI